MSDLSIVRWRATDSSGRGIYASDYMWLWWTRCVLAHPDVKPFAHLVTITQGAWMTKAGGGAGASAGYHDQGGCFDLRVWNLTGTQQTTLIRVLRATGAAAWLRNLTYGGFSDPHIHLVLGSDYSLHYGAAWQWREYLAGRNGLASSGSDYHPRPNPLVLKPPANLMEDDDMPYTDWPKADREALAADVAKAVAAQIKDALTAIPRQVWRHTVSKDDKLAVELLRKAAK